MFQVNLTNHLNKCPSLSIELKHGVRRREEDSTILEANFSEIRPPKMVILRFQPVVFSLRVPLAPYIAGSSFSLSSGQAHQWRPPISRSDKNSPNDRWAPTIVGGPPRILLTDHQIMRLAVATTPYTPKRIYQIHKVKAAYTQMHTIRLPVLCKREAKQAATPGYLKSTGAPPDKIFHSICTTKLNSLSCNSNETYFPSCLCTT